MGPLRCTTCRQPHENHGNKLPPRNAEVWILSVAWPRSNLEKQSKCTQPIKMVKNFRTKVKTLDSLGVWISTCSRIQVTPKLQVLTHITSTAVCSTWLRLAIGIGGWEVLVAPHLCHWVVADSYRLLWTAILETGTFHSEICREKRTRPFIRGLHFLLWLPFWTPFRIYVYICLYKTINVI